MILNRTTKIALVIILLLVLSLFVMDCSHRRATSKLQEQITTTQLENQTLKQIVNKNGDTITTQKMIITSSQKALESLTDSIFNLKKKQEREVKRIIAYFTEKSKVKIDSVDVPYVDTIAMKKFSDSVTKNCQEVLSYMRDSTITVPRTGSDSTSTYSISLTATKEKFTVNSLSIPDSSYYRIDELKGGLFKKRSFEIKSFHTSPHIQVQSQNSVIYKAPPKPRWLEKAIIVAAGIFIGTKL